MEQNKPLKYKGYAIVCEEVPDEVSLAFNISGCEHKCPGCHSQYLWEYTGDILKNDISQLIEKYAGLISCICFLGGDQNIEELKTLCKIVKGYGLKTCIYSGEDTCKPFMEMIHLNLIDYLKIGKYDIQRGPLNFISTNQIMYKITDSNLLDITYLFWINA